METTLEQQAVELVGNAKVLTPPFGMDFRTWFEYKKGLESKRSLVRSQVKRIAKNGVNQSEGYRYAEAADIYDQINDIMYESKLGFAAEYLRDEIVTAKNGAPINKVYLLITWTDLDNGYFEQQEIAGFGLDYGDKGIYKAYTGAAKYSLVLNFLIPTGDDPARGPMDPENDRNDAPPISQQARGQQNGPQNSRNGQGQANGGRNQQNGNTGQQSGRGNAKPQEVPPPTEPPADHKQQEAPAEDKQQDKPADEQKQTTETPENKESTNGAEEQQEAIQGTQEATEGGTSSAGPITSEQVGKIKAKVLTLAAFADDKNKKVAQDAVYQSLTIKQELRAWGERVKGMAQADMITALTTNEAAKAIEYLDAWIAQKEKTRGK